MPMTSVSRTGKIARLPRAIRDQLNRRLYDGEPGVLLLEWLNALPPVLEILKHHFEGRPVTEQNLSEWKQNGYRDWLQHQQACERIHFLAERAEDLEDAADQLSISDRIASILAAELCALIEQLLEETADPKERWRRLQEVLRELRYLRHHDHHRQRIQIQRERWDIEHRGLIEQRAEREIKKAKNKALAPLFSHMMEGALAGAFGPGEAGKKAARLVSDITYDQFDKETLDPPSPAEPPSAPSTPAQAKSN